jgi:hypothetical protein
MQSPNAAGVESAALPAAAMVLILHLRPSLIRNRILLKLLHLSYLQSSTLLEQTQLEWGSAAFLTYLLELVVATS